MRCFTVYWNDKEGEARISYADWFKPDTDSGSQIVILDALNDVIWDLSKFYDTTINTEPKLVDEIILLDSSCSINFDSSLMQLGEIYSSTSLF